MATSTHMLYKLYTCIKESSFMHLDACLSHRSVLSVNMFTANIPVPSPVVKLFMLMALLSKIDLSKTETILT